MSSSAPIEAEEQVVVFRLETERYGLDIFRVSEIIRLREVTPIPQTPSHIRGLVNLRGKTIPVMDLRARFMLLESADTDETRIIVVEGADGQVGLVVDEVCEVATLQPDQVEAPPTLVTHAPFDFVRGIAKRNDELVTLLDLDQAIAG